MKTCTKCGLEKPLADFYRASGTRDGLRGAEGKERQRAGHLKRKYGITIEQYEELLAAQSGKCAICRREPVRQLRRPA